MGRIVKNLQDGFINFHGCGLYHREGSNVLITKKRPCYHPIIECFWMRPEHVHKKVTTRKRESSKTVHLASIYRKYIQQLHGGKVNYYSTDEDSETDSDTDSDDDTLIIDDKNAKSQVPDNKNNENETEDQIPGRGTWNKLQAVLQTHQTRLQTTNNKFIPCTILL